MKRFLLATALTVVMAAPAFATNTTNQTTIGNQSVTGTNTNNVVTVQGGGTGSGKVSVGPVGSFNHTTINQNKTSSDNRKYNTVNNNQKTVNAQKTFNDNSRTLQGGSATATGGQGGQGGQGGSVANSVQTGDVVNGGNTVTVEGAKRSAIAPGMGGMASGPCSGVSGGVSLGWVGFSGGVQGAGEDKQCTLRENIRTVSQFDPAVAAEMLNDLDGVQAAKERIAKARTAQAPAAQAPQMMVSGVMATVVNPQPHSTLDAPSPARKPDLGGPTNWDRATDFSHMR